MKMQKQSDNQKRNPYNIKILRNFVVYFRERLGWSDLEIEEVFENCGSHLSVIHSDDNWFNQDFSDRFYAQAVEKSKDEKLAYKVAVFNLSHATRGIGGRLVQGSLSPEIAFRNIQKIAKAYTNASYYEPISVSGGKAVIRSFVAKGYEERPYQCLNRLGMLESAPAFFGCSNISTIHERCLHKGDSFCEYTITWLQPLKSKPIPLAGGVAIATLAILLLLSKSTAIAILGAFGAGMTVYQVLREIFLSEIKRILDEQNIGLEESLKIIGRRKDEQILLRNIINMTSEMMPINELCTTTVNLIRKEMQYDRAIMLLVDKESMVLKMQACAGFEDHLTGVLEKIEFKIRPDNTDGFFIRVVNSKQPILERDAQAAMERLSERSRDFLVKLGTKAFIAVPILFRGEVFGVLSVENTDAAKPLTTNDRDLMYSLGEHIAVAISNRINFEATLASLRRTQELEAEQRQAKEIFERYVPTAVRDETQLEVRKNLTSLDNKIITVMFIDLIGFTSLSEKMGPQRVAELLGVYIRYINEIVINTGGRINKIIGDGLMIYFEEGEGSAIRTGFDILFGLPVLNKKLKNLGFEEIAIAVGAHKGPCTLGSIGYEKRLDYTIIGDTVNTAARIEAKTRDWGPNTFLFSASLIQEAEEFVSLSRGSMKLKGKDIEIELFQLLFPKIFEKKQLTKEEREEEAA